MTLTVLNLPTKAGSSAPVAPTVIELNTNTDHISLVGANNDDHLGGNTTLISPDFRRARTITSGDFNRDNVPDLVISAPEADVVAAGSIRPDAGAVYLVFGGISLAVPAIVDPNPLAPNQPSLKIFGAAAGDTLGFAVAAGDVNGDAIDDLVIGAPGADFPGVSAGNPARANSGAVFVLFGPISAVGQTFDLATANTADVIVYGARAGDLFGSALAVGNVGGVSGTFLREQNIKDILIGAPENRGPSPVSSPRMKGGAAYLLFGTSTGFRRVGAATRMIDLGVTSANLTVYGRTGNALGSAVAIGDVNANNVGDVLVGAPLSDRPSQLSVPAAVGAGAVFVIFGGSAASSRTFDLNATSANLSIYGASAGDHLGASVAGGDVTGETLGDLIIGAPDADGPNDSRPDAGEVYVIAGNTNLTVRRRIDVLLGPLVVTVFGARSGDRLGATVAAGNVGIAGHSDNIVDLLIGAPSAEMKKGAVSIIFGGPDAFIARTRDILLGQDDVRVIGGATGDELGWSIAAADFDNNTRGNVIISSPFAGIEANLSIRLRAGRVYGLLP
jgi:hypothetical protein